MIDKPFGENIEYFYDCEDRSILGCEAWQSRKASLNKVYYEGSGLKREKDHEKEEVKLVIQVF